MHSVAIPPALSKPGVSGGTFLQDNRAWNSGSKSAVGFILPISKDDPSHCLREPPKKTLLQKSP